MSIRLSIFLCGLTMLLLAGGLHAETPDPAVTAAQAAIKAADGEIAKSTAQRQHLRNDLGRVEQHLATLEARRARSQAIQDDLAKRAGGMRKTLLELDRQIARLTPPYDLVEAWHAYDKAPDAGKPAAFRALFRLARGRDPNNSEMADYRLEAMILHKEIVDKTVVPVGLALAGIGELITDYIKYVAGVASEVPKSIEAISEAAEAVEALEALGHIAGANLQQYVPEFKEAAQVVNGILAMMPRSPELLKKWEQVRDEARNMAEDSYRSYKEAVYGSADPVALRKKLQGDHAALSKNLALIEAGVEDTKRPLARWDAAIAPVRRVITEIDAQLKQLDQAIAAAEAAKEQATARLQVAQAAQQLAGHKGQILVSHVAMNLPARPRYSANVDLAADDLTANVLAMPRETPYTLSIGLADATSVPCLYCNPREDGELSCGVSSKQIILGAGTVARHPGVVPTAAPPLVKIDETRQKIIGQKPGHSEVSLVASGMVGSDTSKHSLQEKSSSVWHVMDYGRRHYGVSAPCDWNVRPVGGTLKGGTVPLVVHQIQDMRLLEMQPPAQPRGDERWLAAASDIDLFLADPGVNLHVSGWASLRPELTVATGENESRRSMVRATPAVLAELFGDSGAFQVQGRQYRNDLLVMPQTAGQATLKVALADAAGNRQFERQVKVTANRVLGAGLLMPEGEYARGMESVLAIGETARLRFLVDGPGNPGAYQVRWQARSRAAGVEYETFTPFERKDGRWVAENRVRFTPALIRGNAFKHGSLYDVMDASSLAFNVELLSGGGRILASVITPQIQPTLPLLDNIEFVLLDSGLLKVAGLDLFYPAPPGGHIGRLGVVAEYAGGQVVMPLWMLDVSQIGHFPEYFRLETSQSYDDVGTMRLYSRNRQHTDLSSRDTGTGMVYATLHTLRAGEKRLKLSKPRLDDALQIRFNKLVVERLGEMSGPARFRLHVLGPSDVSNYTTRWTLSDGATETGRLARGEDGQTGSTEHAYAGFEQVELIAPTGRVAGMYVGSRDGTPLPPPTIHVQSLNADLLVPGATLGVSAQTSGVREIEAEDYLCRWEVDPAFGRVEPSSSGLRVELVWGNCETTLKLSDNPDIAGRPFPIKVKLVRLTGVLQ